MFSGDTFLPNTYESKTKWLTLKFYYFYFSSGDEGKPYNIFIWEDISLAKYLSISLQIVSNSLYHLSLDLIRSQKRKIKHKSTWPRNKNSEIKNLIQYILQAILPNEPISMNSTNTPIRQLLHPVINQTAVWWISHSCKQRNDIPYKTFKIISIDHKRNGIIDTEQNLPGEGIKSIKTILLIEA